MPGKGGIMSEKPDKRAVKGRPKYDPLPKSLLNKAAEAAINRTMARPAVGKRRPVYDLPTVLEDVVDNREKDPVLKKILTKASMAKRETRSEREEIQTKPYKKFKTFEPVLRQKDPVPHDTTESTPPVLVEVLSFQKIEKLSEIEKMIVATTKPTKDDEKIEEMKKFLADMKKTFGIEENDDDDPGPTFASSTPIKSTPEPNLIKKYPESGIKQNILTGERRKSKKKKGERVDWSKVPVADLSLYATDSEEEVEICTKIADHPNSFTKPDQRQQLDFPEYYESMSDFNAY